MPPLCVCFQIASPTPHSRYSSGHPSLSYPTAPGLRHTPEEMEKVLSTLDSDDSATGLDGISSRILKTCSAALTHPPSTLFTIIFTRSSSICLEIRHHCITLKKIKKIMDPFNYRPISFQSSAVMESIIAGEMKSFLFSNILISNHQFSFRLGPST